MQNYRFSGKLYFQRSKSKINSMAKKVICRSEADLMEIHQMDDGTYVLEIVDFGHAMASDFRIIPKDKLAGIIAKFNDKKFCENLSRNRTQFKPHG
jgi:hypothetical protein